MPTPSRPTVQRGITRVAAHGDTPSVPALVANLNQAFVDFKASHNARIDAVSANVENLQRAVDDANTRLAAQQMNGSGAPTADEGTSPTFAAAGLRGSGEFRQFYTARASNASESSADAHLGDMLRAVAGLKAKSAALASLSEGTDTAGGYSVPRLVMPTILDALAESSALLRAGASILPFEHEGALTITVPAIDTLPTPSWRLEKGDVALSAPTFRGQALTPRSLSVIVKCSRELLADSPDMDRAVRTAVGTAFAAELDRVGLVGTGSAPEPKGIDATAGVIHVAQAGAALSWKDMLAGTQRILENKGPMPTSAIGAPRSMIGLAGLTDTTGQPLNRPPLLDGVQVIPTVGVPTDLGDDDDESLLFLGDFRTVQFIMRERLTVARLSEAFAGTGEIGFLFHMRVDVAINYPGALAVITGVK
ncbi:MAG: phage major capsid protein [Rhodanobacteraceae bacterium]|jgi:HK97 family phage major capsid protein|nr:phage major capsid protein [Rhodanobacteraceae bacterium]